VLLALDDRQPLYQQIHAALRGRILAGDLGPGARLPATRTLAEDAGVSRNVVLLAYDQLLAEGYVVGRIGAGTFVASELPDSALGVGRADPAPPRRARRRAAPLSAYARRVPRSPAVAVRPAAIGHEFRFGAPAVQDFPFHVWRRLLARRARAVGPASLTYGAPEGYGPLREALADYLGGARGVRCRPDQVLVVNGAQQALDLVARALLDPGHVVAIEEPQYLGAREAFQAAGARLLPVPVDAEGLVVSRLPAPASPPRLVYITPSHQFPTGATMSLARRLALLQWAGQAGTWIVEDDYDSEYRYSGRPIEALQALDRTGCVIYVGTLSKTLFPALRLGYVVAPEPLVRTLRAIKALTDRHTATLPQEVLADFIREGHFERHLRRTRTRNAARRAALLDAVATRLGPDARVEGANAGLHALLWLDGVSPARLDDVVQRAQAAGVGLYAVRRFYLRPPRRAGLLLGYAGLTEADIRRGIDILADLLRSGRRSGSRNGSPVRQPRV
jgi:GntR family transcriptional regulator/MocR family aminotransferase